MDMKLFKSNGFSKLKKNMINKLDTKCGQWHEDVNKRPKLITRTPSFQ